MLKEIYKIGSAVFITLVATLLFSGCIFGHKYVTRVEYDADRKYTTDTVDLKFEHIITMFEELKELVKSRKQAGDLATLPGFANRMNYVDSYISTEKRRNYDATLQGVRK